jgi:hypothetical protein
MLLHIIFFSDEFQERKSDVAVTIPLEHSPQTSPTIWWKCKLTKNVNLG